jgi:hypothetical protein
VDDTSGGSLTVRPWRWIILASGIPTVLTIAGLLILVLPLLLGNGSPLQVVAGLAVTGYFGLMAHSCLTSRLTLNDGGIAWSDPFSRGSLTWDQIESLSVRTVDVPNFWLTGPRASQYNALAIKSEAGTTITVAASLLANSHRESVKDRLCQAAESKHFGASSDLEDIGASWAAGRTLEEQQRELDESETLHYRLGPIRRILQRRHRNPA